MPQTFEGLQMKLFRSRKKKRRHLNPEQDMLRGMVITAILIFAILFTVAYYFPASVAAP